MPSAECEVSLLENPKVWQAGVISLYFDLRAWNLDYRLGISHSAYMRSMRPRTPLETRHYIQDFAFRTSKRNLIGRRVWCDVTHLSHLIMTWCFVVWQQSYSTDSYYGREDRGGGAITVLFRPDVQSCVTATSELNTDEPASHITVFSEQSTKWVTKKLKIKNCPFF